MALLTPCKLGRRETHRDARGAGFTHSRRRNRHLAPLPARARVPPDAQHKHSPRLRRRNCPPVPPPRKPPADDARPGTSGRSTSRRKSFGRQSPRAEKQSGSATTQRVRIQRQASLQPPALLGEVTEETGSVERERAFSRRTGTNKRACARDGLRAAAAFHLACGPRERCSRFDFWLVPAEGST